MSQGKSNGQIGRELYQLFIQNYTRKQWGLDPSARSVKWQRSHNPTPTLLQVISVTFVGDKRKGSRIHVCSDSRTR